MYARVAISTSRPGSVRQNASAVSPASFEPNNTIFLEKTADVNSQFFLFFYAVYCTLGSTEGVCDAGTQATLGVYAPFWSSDSAGGQ